MSQPQQQQYMHGYTKATQQRHGLRNASNTCQYYTHLLQPDYHVLDVGCGPGSISSSLARLVPQGKVIGIDSSDKALTNARNQTDLPSNCSFQVGDALKLDFPDGTFDVVQTSQVLCHIPQIVDALREFRRVLKPGGFIACREGDTVNLVFHPAHPGLDEWARAISQSQVQSSADPATGRKLLAFVVEAGFEAEKCTFTGAAMTYAGKEGAVFGQTMAMQMVEDENFRKGVIEKGVSDQKGLELMRAGWETWANDPCCVFDMFCGQVVAYK